MTTVDKILADLIKGASQNGKAVEVKQEGREEKLASAQPYLREAFAKGKRQAASRYKIAFLGPLLGMAANAGGATLAAKALGSRAAGIGGQMLTNLGGQVAQAGAERLMAPRQPAAMPYLR